MIGDCTALILAGGDSSRMGQDKATLVLDGATLLQHAVAAVEPLFPHVLVSVRQPRAGLAWPQVCDLYADSGPLAGLAAGLEQAGTSWVFALACDMPYVSGKVVEALAVYRDGCQAVVPLVDGHPQPLAAFYAESALPVMRAALREGEKRLRSVLQRLDACYVDEAALRGFDPQLRSFVDLDTPQDVRAAMQDGHSRAGGNPVA